MTSTRRLVAAAAVAVVGVLGTGGVAFAGDYSGGSKDSNGDHHGDNGGRHHHKKDCSDRRDHHKDRYNRNNNNNDYGFGSYFGSNSEPDRYSDRGRNRCSNDYYRWEDNKSDFLSGILGNNNYGGGNNGGFGTP